MAQTSTGFQYIEEIIAANKRAGYHFFDKDTLRFFRSRVLDDVYPMPDGSALFITSEQYSYRDTTEPRKYTVRRAEPTGNIGAEPEGPDSFQKHATLYQARKAAKALSNAS